MVALFPASPAHSRTRAATIKILNLLTNRYHVGIVHHTSADTFDIEMPRAARLCAGQHVRFALSDPSIGIIPRHTMRSALIRHVNATARDSLRVDLSPAAECVAA